MNDAERLIAEDMVRHMAANVDEMFLNPEKWKRDAEARLVGQPDIREEILEFGHETELYCPGCGKKGLWVEAGDGDYYQGPLHWCPPERSDGCGEFWSIP